MCESNETNKESVPVLSLPKNERIDSLYEHFTAKFKQKPDYYIRVPGRVNLIGEHIDYCGYGVCPMAIEQDIMLAVSVSLPEFQEASTLRLANVDTKHADYECDMKSFSIDTSCVGPQWFSYFLCGVRGVLEILPQGTSLISMRVAVTGNVPQSSGLSSSSALVSAAALATAYGYKLEISKSQIASLSADCERYIGTQGGGMDQAIAFLASEGCAKLIDFNPLRSSDVTLPDGAVFVIAHSLARLNKAATADFNCRVVECRLAAQILAKKHNLNWEKLTKISDFQKAIGIELKAMLPLIEEHLPADVYSKEEICALLEVTDEELEKTSLTPNTKHLKHFKLKQRAVHVVQEADRVQQFHITCQGSGGEAALQQLGQLMYKSHASLKDLYECSHPNLDRLVDLSKEIALGARLTGAGWGGCMVALVPPIDVQKYIKTLKERFYKELGVKDGLDQLVFATSPKSGACVYL